MVSLVKMGFSVSQASKVVGIEKSGVSQWKSKDPVFAQQLADAYKERPAYRRFSKEEIARMATKVFNDLKKHSLQD